MSVAGVDAAAARWSTPCLASSRSDAGLSATRTWAGGPALVAMVSPAAKAPIKRTKLAPPMASLRSGTRSHIRGGSSQVEDAIMTCDDAILAGAGPGARRWRRRQDRQGPAP